jgi:hypothetical protein
LHLGRCILGLLSQACNALANFRARADDGGGDGFAFFAAASGSTDDGKSLGLESVSLTGPPTAALALGAARHASSFLHGATGGDGFCASIPPPTFAS